MSGRPTPETDTETMRDEYDHVDTDLGPFAPSDTVPADFARKLERERDEAREELAEEIKFHHRTHSELVQTQCQMQDVIREREAALEGAK